MDQSRILSRLSAKGVTSVGGNPAFAHFLIRLDEDGNVAPEALPNSLVINELVGTINIVGGLTVNGGAILQGSELSTHIADATKHLTSGQNTFLDAVTVTAIEVNRLAGVTSPVQTQLTAGVTALTTHTSNVSNPHSVTKTQVGLANVDNTSDVNKPISTATQAALDLKAATATVTAHTANTSNPHGVTKAQVGLSNVDNTADLAKPISTATQAALNLKVSSSNTTLTGTTTLPVTTTIGAVTGSEISFLAGVTSSIQTQLNSKIGSTGVQTFTGAKTFSSQAQFDLGIQINDGSPLTFETTGSIIAPNGLTLGVNGSSLIGFYGINPIAKPSGNILTGLVNLGLMTAPTLTIPDVTALTASLAAKQDISQKNVGGGYCPLDAGGLVPLANIPDFVIDGGVITV